MVYCCLNIKILPFLVDPVPIVLQGEGHYALTAIKDIRVTEELVGLGQEVTRCQTREARADCVTRRHRQKILQSCHCAPLYLSQHFPHQVPSISHNIYIM